MEEDSLSNELADKHSKSKAALELSLLDKSKSNDSLVEQESLENEEHETTRWCKFEDFVKHCDQRYSEK